MNVKISLVLLAMTYLFISNASGFEAITSFATPYSHPEGLAWDGSYLWLADSGEKKIYKIDPSDGRVIKSFAAPDRYPEGLAWDGTYLWLADSYYGKEKIYKIDPSDGKVIASFAAPSRFLEGLAWDGSYLWLADSNEEKIYKIDPSDGSFIPFNSPGNEPTGLAWDGSYLWLVDGFVRETYPYSRRYDRTFYIYKIDPSDGHIINKLAYPYEYPEGLAWDGSYLWLVDSDEEKIYKIEVDFITSMPTPTVTQPSEPSPVPTTTPTTPITPSTEIQIQGFSIQDIQKSSETAPEINIEPIEEQTLSNTTVLLSGTASSDSGIESVTVNGQYAGTEYWSAPLALSLGDNNIVIVSTGNDGSTTIEKVRLTATTFESESKRSSHVLYFVAFIGAIATIGAAIIIARYTKTKKEK